MKKTAYTAILALLASGSTFAASTGYLTMTEVQKDGVAFAYDFSKGSTTPVVGTVNLGGSGWSSDAFTNSNGVMTIGSNGVKPWTSRVTGVGNNWTLSFDVNSIDNAGGTWKSLVTLYSGNATTYFNHGMAFGVANPATKVTLQNGLGDADTPSFTGTDRFSIDSGLTTDKFSNTTVTIVTSTVDTTGTISLYINGALAGSQTFENPDDMSLTGFQFGAAFSNNDVITQAKVSNITVWNKALTADQVKSIVVPEPATATLSLLALAGLAARRRRK